MGWKQGKSSTYLWLKFCVYTYMYVCFQIPCNHVFLTPWYVLLLESIWPLFYDKILSLHAVPLPGTYFIFFLVSLLQTKGMRFVQIADEDEWFLLVWKGWNLFPARKLFDLLMIFLLPTFPLLMLSYSSVNFVGGDCFSPTVVDWLVSLCI